VNALVPPQTTIILTVPVGLAPVTVPKDLTGRSVTFAQNAILNDNLKLGPQTPVLSTKVKPGLVSGTDPPEGSRTAENTPVTIFVSLGPGDTVPNVVGMTASAAETAITGAHLSPQEILKPSTLKQQGLVISQNPGPSQQQAGSTVTITVGQGPTSTVTVTSPGPQTSVLHASINPLQISATDSVPGRSLTYTATGLPSGLSIDPSSGVISGTPLKTGSYRVIVTVTDSTGASGSTSFMWQVKHH
jgi:beta-lactam-binding protein with PASTA domain